MSKRFTDTGKWGKQWFRKLPVVHKCFWVYICDSCNLAGFWDVDWDMAEYFIGEKLNVEEIKKQFEKQYIEVGGGTKWLIKDFIPFQYGDLKDNNNVHKAVLKSLASAGVHEGLISPCQGAKDKDKEKDKDKGGVGEFDFDAIWDLYPKKLGKSDAIRHFKKSVRNQEDYENIQRALRNFLGSKIAMGDPQYIPHGSTWFHNWRDWVDFNGSCKVVIPRKPANPECTNCRGLGSVYAPGSGKNVPCSCTKM